jgi:hypothetical protein
MAIFEEAVKDAGNIDFQASPTVDCPVNFTIASSTICITVIVSTPLESNADLLKLTTTRPGHLLPGPGEVTAADDAKIVSTFEAMANPAAPAIPTLRKFRRLVDIFFLMAFPFLWFSITIRKKFLSCNFLS